MRLSIVMEVIVRDRDVTVEPIGILLNLMRHPLLNLVTQFTPGSMRLSTVMEVTVRDRDVTVEHTGMCLLRVTVMTVLNHFSHYIVRTDVSFVAFLVESC